MKPRGTKKEKDLLKQKSDNKSTKEYWMMDNLSSVTICHQRNGEHPVWMIKNPKERF